MLITNMCYSQCQISCNDLINISLDLGCDAEITVDMVYEGSYDPACNFFVVLDGIGGNMIDAPGNYTYRLYSPEGNFCWGEILAEDKELPAPNCTCESAFIDNGAGVLVPDPNCTFRCYDVWDLEILEADGGNNELLPDVDDNLPSDNCLVFDDPAINISIFDGANCEDKIVRRQIIYSYPNWDGTTGYVECNQEFLFQSIDVASLGSTTDGVWPNNPDEGNFDYYTPQEFVDMPCGSETTPAAIVAHFDLDTPGRPAGKDRDDYDNTPNIVEFNEGYAYAYPYVVVQGWRGNYHAKPIINNICNIYASYTDDNIDGCGVGCKGNEKVLRMWTILDWCTSTTLEFTQIISTKDIEAPTVSQGDLTYSVDPWSCARNIEFPAPEHLHDNCDSDLSYGIIAPTGISINGNTAYDVPKGIHTFYYTATDCCGNVGSSAVQVSINDLTPPTAITVEHIVLNLTNDVDADGIAKLYAQYADNGSHDGCGPVHLEIRRVEDICGFVGNTTFNNDNHSNDDINDPDGGDYVKFCCEDVDPTNIDSITGNAFGEVDVILRVWDDGDMDGTFGTAGDNYNESWLTVRVEDKLDPIVVCPPHVIMECDEDFLDYDFTGVPVVFNTCSEGVCEITDNNPRDQFQKKSTNAQPLQGVEVPAYNPSCRSGAIKRTWTCGEKTCVQWIIVNEEPNQTLVVDYPEDQEVTCSDFDAGEPTYTDQQCELIGVNMESDTFFFEDGACFKVLNHWTVINWCDYDAEDTDLNEITEPTDDGVVPGISTHTQVIKMVDDVRPELVIQDTCFAVTVDCTSENLVLKATATDNGACGSPWLKWEVEVDAWSDWDVDWTYSSFLPADNDYYINPTAGSGSFSAPTANGESVCIALPDGIPSACGLPHRVLWKVHDGCGNTTTGTSYFTVEDKKKPTPYCLNLSTALMVDGSVELWARDFNAGSFDNCTEQDYLKYTFSSVVPAQLLDDSLDPWYDADGEADEDDYLEGDAEQWLASSNSSARVFDCDDYALALANGGMLPVEIYAWDECGNYDFCVVNLTLVDNQDICGIEGNRAIVSGSILTDNGAPISNVDVNISANTEGGYNNTVTTNNIGEYVFTDVITNNSYSINGDKDIDWMNGVSTLDLVLIQKHILGLENFDSPYKLIAADANNDERVSSIDLISLRKLILGIETNISGNTSWRFMPSSLSMDPQNPWNFNENINIQNLLANTLEENFIGVKVGDVNSTNDFAADATSLRSTSSLDFNINEVRENGIVTLEFSSTNFNDIHGFQFTLETSNLEILSVHAKGIDLNESNVANFNDKLSVSWFTDKARSLDSEVLFTVTANELSTASTKLNITDAITVSEAYDSAYNVLDVNLINTVDAEFALVSIEPNPWKEQSQIIFNIDSDKEVSITIYDTTGKTVYENSDFFTKGLNAFNLNEGELLTDKSGIFYYTISDGTQFLTAKMIKIK